jgi:hypothetical protein
MSLFFLGQSPTTRSAIACKVADQSKKNLALVRQYIETSNALRLVFPNLIPSTNPADPWNNESITIERPRGMKDPSMVATSIGKSIAGARLSWAIADDIHDEKNTETPEQIEKTWKWFDQVYLQRLDPKGRLIVINTAWSQDDIPHKLIDMGWAGLKMDVYGDIRIFNVPTKVWNPDYLRPRFDGLTVDETGPFRLSHWDYLAPSEKEADNIPLWPSKFTPEVIEGIRSRMLPHRFSKVYCQKCYSDDVARCQIAWIEKCLEFGRSNLHHQLVSKYDGSNPTVTGVDLAVQKGKGKDFTCFSTWEFLPNGVCKLLDIESAQLNGPEILRKLVEKQARYKSVIVVESNAAQDYIRQFMLDTDKSFPIYAHHTGANKLDPNFGVEGLFLQIKNGAWMLPSSIPKVPSHPQVQKLIDACIYYTPTRHTSDQLMATWFAISKGRELLAFANIGKGSKTLGKSTGIASSLMAR